MNAHMFIDAENVKPEVGFMAVEKFRREYTIDRVDIIGKEDVISQRYRAAGEPYRVQNCYFGKNSADTWLCVEIAKTIFDEAEVDTIIIVSSDRDFLPAIKLAVEKDKKVIVISNGFGHRNLRRLLRELKINLAKVQLVDYRDGLTITEDEPKKKKKSLSDLMKDATPTFVDLRAQKIKKFYARLSFANEKFFRKREDRIKFIFVKHGESLHEIPFVDGMNIVVFGNVLRELQIIGKKADVNRIVADSLLNMDGSKIYFPSAEDLIGDWTEPSAAFDNLSLSSLDYFTANNVSVEIIFLTHGEDIFEVPFVPGIGEKIFMQVLFERQVISTQEDFAKVLAENFLSVDCGKIYLQNVQKKVSAQTIFISYGGEFIEIPFENGMAVEKFMRTLRDSGVVGDNKFIKQVISDSFLKIRGGKVYLSFEENIFQDDGGDFLAELEYLSASSRKFLFANAEQLNFVRVLYEGVLYDVPFVNGMNFSTFAQIVEELGITTKGASRNVLTGNGFKIIHGMVYL